MPAVLMLRIIVVGVKNANNGWPDETSEFDDMSLVYIAISLSDRIYGRPFRRAVQDQVRRTPTIIASNNK
jgi:hypothetical protein